MAQISRQVGTTSQVTLLFIQDSSSTTGAGLTGLAYNTASLACYYKRSSGTASVAVTLANITTLGTFVSGGFKEVDATNLPGVYEFHPPNAALDSGADSVAFLLKGAANMAPCPLIIELTGTSNQDTVRGGMTALPNAVASASGGLLTYGTSTGQVNPSSGKVPATLASTDVTGNVAADLQTIKTQTVTCSGGVTIPAATLASTTNITAGTITTVTTATNVTTVNGLASGVVTAASIASNAITAAKIATDAIGAAQLAADAVTEIQSGLSTLNAAGVRTAIGLSSANLDTQLDAMPTASENAIATWDLATAGHTTSGTFGAAAVAAGSAGDPWSTSLPGAYGAGTAGYIVGTNLNATVSSRSAFDPSATGVKLTSAGLDLVVIETGLNARQALSVIASANGGVLSGADTGSVIIKGAGVATTRITATTDSTGRPTVTLSPPA